MKHDLAAKGRFSELLGSTMVKVIVGPAVNSREFQLHKDLLCISSEFFDAMFNGSFTEAQESVATLPEDDPEVFSKFAAWIYRGVIESDPILDAEHYMEERISLFAFAENYQLGKLMDDIMEIVCYETAEFNLGVTIGDIEYGYRHTHENSKMRLYLLRNLAHSILEKKDVGDSSTCKLMPDGPDAQEIVLEAIKAMRSPEGQPFSPYRLGERFRSEILPTLAITTNMEPTQPALIQSIPLSQTLPTKRVERCVVWRNMEVGGSSLAW